MKYLAIMAILICSSVSLAAPRRSIRSPAVPLWTQPEAWQKLAKSMTTAQVTAILGAPLHMKEGTGGVTWSYQEGEDAKGVIRFRLGKVSVWKEPNWQLVKEDEQARLEVAAEIAALKQSAIEAEKLAVEKAEQAKIEKKRLEAELKRAEIEKAQLIRKLQIEQRTRIQRERRAERKAAPSKPPEKKDSFFDKLVASSVIARVFIYAGGGFLVLAILYVHFCWKPRH